MKAVELRIGNYVKTDNDLVIKSYSPEGLYNILKNIDEYKPIPLTEEWLLKFGFVSNPYEDRYELRREYHIYIEIDKTKGFTEIWCEKYPIIKHVHQLQNLYFALTGEELTFKSE